MRPQLDQMPLPIQRHDDPFLPFGKAIINATRDLLCGYMFDVAAYLALGAAGAVALERSIAYVGDERLSILHGPFASSDYVQAAGLGAFNVDAVTLTSADDAQAYLREDVGVFILDGKSDNVGSFDVDNRVLMFDGIVLRLLSDDVLYATHGDDFSERVRSAVRAQI
jgi:hypothetical protein